jgi:aminoglycoside phosphotransferase family enzyme
LRRKFCQKEVGLNKLLCLDIYIGVVRILQESDGSIRIRDMNTNLDRRPGVKTLEYAVKMKEIPQSYRMEHLVCKARISTKMITRLAEVLVKFHNSTPTNNRIMLF